MVASFNMVQVLVVLFIDLRVELILAASSSVAASLFPIF